MKQVVTDTVFVRNKTKTIKQATTKPTTNKQNKKQTTTKPTTNKQNKKQHHHQRQNNLPAKSYTFGKRF